jgi:hypothetical protein
MNRNFYSVVVNARGKEHVCQVYACSIFHAIDILYYELNYRDIQPDRTKYKQLKTK